MDKHIDIHPISESEGTDAEEEEDFRTPVLGPHSPRAAREDDLASHGSGEDDAKPASEPEKPSVAVQAESIPLTSSVEGSELDDSLRIKDLDTGREMLIHQRNTIRDLNTGHVYLLDTEEDIADLPAHSGYTDVVSGTKMSAEEFDRALGLASYIGTRRQRRMDGLASDSDDETSSSAEAARKSPKAKTPRAAKAKNWLKKRSNALFQSSRFGKESRQGAEGSSSPEIAGNGRKSNASTATAEDNGSDDDDDAISSRSQSQSSTPMRGSQHFLEEMAADAPPQSVGVPVKVHVHKKLHRDLTDLCLVQELQAHSGVMWTMKFSKNGQYLASAGQDAVIRVWEIVSTRGGPPPTASADGASENGHTEESGGDEERERVVLKPQPVRVYQGHKQDVLDIAWSKSQFLLSASMDKTVRLWHFSMNDCLRVFRHTDFVTALDFHPVDDKFFISGSIDGKVRVWNIPEQKVQDWADVHEMVTAVAWSHNGEQAVVGSMKGKCRFYSCAPRTHGLEYTGQIDVKNKRGKASKGRKITGMQYAPGEAESLLITSNDSRIRLYNGFALKCKYKGNSNRNTQIRATFSQAGGFVICGSDDGWVYVWSLASSSKEKSASYECFHAHDDIVTVAVFAPETAWLPVGQSLQSKPKGSGGVAEGLNKLNLRQRLSKEDSASASAAASNAVAAQASNGPVILTAGYGGEIKIFECLGAPQML
ncbi:hypothetical protein WJX73_008422 [Symbiochloris irregularis]|uniref:WD repeat-containing protein 44 n=1 Tax=Symbiochloris irregularis TaxID=706552 RepID=A0AAW1NR85_9CHLO